MNLLNDVRRLVARFVKSRSVLLAGTVGVLAVLAAGVLTAGSDAKTARPSSSTPVKGGNLSIAFDLNAQNCIDPGQDYGLEQRDLDRGLVDSLLDQNPQTGALIPWLATSYSANKNSTAFTFTLRKGVTFSDGEKFNATAVKDTLNGVYKDGALSELGITYLSGYVGTQIINPYEVKVKFSAPNSQFLQAAATTVLGIESPKSFTNTPAQRCLGEFWGTGPFKLASYVPGVSAKLIRRSGYAWPSTIVTNPGAAYLSSITAHWITEDSILVGELDSGELNLAWPRAQLSSANQALIKSSGGSIFERPYPGISDIYLPNISAGRPLSDPEVRTALQESINRAQIASTVFWPGYPTVTGAIESSTQYYADESSLLKYDPKAAEKLLTSDGWKVGAGGYRYKNGKELSLILIGQPNPIETLLQSQLKSVGINLITPQETLAQYEAILNEPGGNYDLAEDYLTRGDPYVLASVLDTGIVKTADSVQAEGGGTAKKIAKLFAEANASIDPAVSAKVYAQLQSYVIKEGVVFPIDERLEVEGVGKGVHGLEVTNEGLIIWNDVWLSK